MQERGNGCSGSDGGGEDTLPPKKRKKCSIGVGGGRKIKKSRLGSRVVLVEVEKKVEGGGEKIKKASLMGVRSSERVNREGKQRGEVEKKYMLNGRDEKGDYRR